MKYKIILVISFLFLTVACQQETIPGHQKMSQEDVSSRQERFDDLEKNIGLFNKEHHDILQLIKKNNKKYLKNSLNLIGKYLFSKKNYRKDEYTSDNFISYLNLFVIAHKTWQESDYQSDVDMNSFLNKFKLSFLDPCLGEENDCSLVRDSLTRMSSLVDVVISIAELEENILSRLKLLGVAYDIASRANEKKLGEMYVATYLLFVKSKKYNKLSTSEIKRHNNNILTIIHLKEWDEATDENIKLFKEIEPWITKKNETVIGEIRKHLNKFFPIYIQKDVEISKNYRKLVLDQYKSYIGAAINLEKYPAYSDIRIAKIKDMKIELLYILLNLYFGKIDSSEAQQYFNLLNNKETSMAQLLGSIKLLIRWNIATLGIKSTKNIAEEFKKQEVKSPSFTKDTIDKINDTLASEWSKFHNYRVEGIKSFIDSHGKYTSRSEQIRSDKFFSSINRNIIKTVIVPNMIAFMYEMTKTEWKRSFYSFIGEVDITAPFLIELMFNGQYSRYWFKFINVDDESDGRGLLKRKTVPYRQEIIDSFYYFLTTKTFKSYSINPDNFIKTISENFLRERLRWIGVIQRKQRERYLSPHSKTRQWAEWCEAIKNKKEIKEKLDYYKLDKFLLPHSKIFFLGATDRSNYRYYLDDFDDSSFTTPNKRMYLMESNDRIRTELYPMLEIVEDLIFVANRFKSKYPQVFKSKLTESNNYKNEAATRIKSYWGQQMYIAENIGDCNAISAKESRRRAQEITFSEREYMEKLVFPLLKAVKNKNISLEEANNIINEVHGRNITFDEEIISDNNNQVSYRLTQQSYLLRVKLLLTEGMSFRHDSFDQLGIKNLDLKPIVGSNLTIEIPNNVLEDTKNPYAANFGQDYRHRYLNYSEGQTDKEFSMDAARKSGNRFYWSEDNRRLAEWEFHESFRYTAVDANGPSFERMKIEFSLQRMLLNRVSYANFSNKNCRSLSGVLPKECYISEEYTISDVANVIADVFNGIKLDLKTEKYLKIIGQHTYLTPQNLTIQLKYEQSLGKSSRDTKSLTYNKLAGFFDLSFELIKSKFMGRVFKNEFIQYDSEAPSGQHKPSPSSCDGERDGCFLRDEVFRANEFYLGRKERPSLLFNFDKEILNRQYKNVKKAFMKKYDALNAIYKNGANFMRNKMEIQHPDVPELKVSTKEDLLPLSSLSIKHDNYKETMEKFLNETTEGFYLEEPRWEEYLYKAY